MAVPETNPKNILAVSVLLLLSRGGGGAHWAQTGFNKENKQKYNFFYEYTVYCMSNCKSSTIQVFISVLGRILIVY